MLPQTLHLGSLLYFKMRAMPYRSPLLCLCLATVAGGMAVAAPVVIAASSALPLHVTYKVTEKPAKCPVGTHPQGGCVWLIGKALETGARWSEMRRLAIVDASEPGLPAGCDAATTTGELYAKQARVQFKGAGYYCPKTDTAWYHYTLDAAQAQRNGLPMQGTIRYTGSSNSETFASSTVHTARPQP